MTLASGAYDSGAAWTEKEARDVRKKLSALASKISSELRSDTVYRSDLFRIFMFRLMRTSHRSREKNDRDYMYFKEHGWFDSDYFYEAGLSTFSRFVGKLSDILARRVTDKR